MIKKTNDNRKKGAWRKPVIPKGCHHFKGECFDCPFPECKVDSKKL